MKVIIVTREPFPYGMAASNRILCYAKGLIANNIDCEVIIVFRTEIFGNTPKNNESFGVYKTVPFRYISGKTQRNRNIILRKFDDLFDLIKTYHYCKRNTTKGDIIISYLREDKINELIIRAARKSGASIIRELCEYPYETVEANKKNERLINYELQSVFPLFDGFITISESLCELALKYKSKNARIVKVPILVDKERTSNVQKIIDEDVPYIFHAGTMTEKKDAILSTLNAFAIAAKQLKTPIKFLLAGPTSPHKNEIDKLVADNNLQDRIVFLGEMKRDDIDRYYKSCSLAILNKNDNIQNRNGFSTKLGEILVSETAVITTSVGEPNYYLKDGLNAYIVKPHNPLLIAEKIVQAFTNTTERDNISKAGRELAEKEFDCVYQGKRLVDFFYSITTQD
jgi:glycosyltransferase involved in cell wall biosynthesis